ncbi:MAG: ribose-phosphate diphosphokinase [Bacteroidota bacterium]
MKILNLSKNFNWPTENGIHYEAFVFHGGEPHIKLHVENTPDPSEEVLIIQRVQQSGDFMLLLLATDALRRSGFQKINTLLPYFPAARQDRVMVPGEPLSLKVYAQLINAQNYERVIIFDPHSDLTPALLNNVQVFRNDLFIEAVLNEINDPELYLVAPDAGAVKKIFHLARQLNITNVITCEKNRNVNNGKLSGFKINATDLKNRTCLIVDDICDGGRTFMGIAKALKNKNAGNIYLAVSHGIFSDGIEKFNGLIDGIFSTDSFGDFENKLVDIINLKTILFSAEKIKSDKAWVNVN